MKSRIDSVCVYPTPFFIPAVFIDKHYHFEASAQQLIRSQTTGLLRFVQFNPVQF